MTLNIKHGVFDAGSLVNVILLFFRYELFAHIYYSMPSLIRWVAFSVWWTAWKLCWARWPMQRVVQYSKKSMTFFHLNGKSHRNDLCNLQLIVLLFLMSLVNNQCSPINRLPLIHPILPEFARLPISPDFHYITIIFWKQYKCTGELVTSPY